jgi:hypothetical protein
MHVILLLMMAFLNVFILPFFIEMRRLYCKLLSLLSFYQFLSVNENYHLFKYFVMISVFYIGLEGGVLARCRVFKIHFNGLNFSFLVNIIPHNGILTLKVYNILIHKLYGREFIILVLQKPHDISLICWHVKVFLNSQNQFLRIWPSAMSLVENVPVVNVPCLKH